MATENVIWTLLPNGVDRDADQLRSTIFVTPRLRTGGGCEPLDAFPLFRHWPDTVANLEFVAEVDGVGTFDLTPDPGPLGVPDPPTWELLFGGHVHVDEPVVQEFGDRRLYSYPADAVAQQVLSLYATVGSQNPTEFPSVQDPVLGALADDLGRIGDYRSGDHDMIERMFHGRNHVPWAVLNSEPNAVRQRSFVLANRFYDRYDRGERLRGRDDYHPAAVPTPPPDRPGLDFHSYVAALGDYPALLRRLALAIDVRMPADAALAGEHRYRLIVRGDAVDWMNAPTATPWMNYQYYDHRFFLPRQRPGGRTDIQDGQLLLQSDFYAVHQIDIDGSALKATNTASTIARRRDLVSEQGATMASTTSSLPALRGGGLTIVRRDAAAHVANQFSQTSVNADAERNGISMQLWADDVIRGYRYDAERDGNRDFRSLVERVGSYRYHRDSGEVVPLDVSPDEGFVKGSSTTAVPGDQDLYLHEAVASWSGWSMVAPRPGAGLTPQDEKNAGRSPREQNELDGRAPLDKGLPLETSFRAAPGSLPALRYGSSYRLRARTVDLAGNSVSREVIGDEHASAPTVFHRWEPVPAPAVLPRRKYGEGESQLRMVIRSTDGVNVADYLALPRVQELADHNVTGLPYLDRDDRWIVAPKTSQQMAELHGMFDEAIGSGDSAKIQQAFEIASRESGALPEVVEAEALSLPYLPDVSSRGIRFNRFFLDPEIYRRINWPSDTGAWWDRQPIRLTISDGPAPAPVTPAGNYAGPVWDEAGRVLSVHVPQAEMYTVRISSAVDAADLELQGMYELILANTVLPEDWNDRRHEALESRNWMLTPWIELTVVHAVEKPLADPVIAVEDAGMLRKRGETFCALDGVIANHAKSTGRLDIEAQWTEQVDDVKQDAPEDGVNGLGVRNLSSHVGDFLLEAFEDSCRVGRDDATNPTGQGNTHQLRHEFGDTRHRVATYHAVATTRFREYFPPKVIDGTEDGHSLIQRSGPETQLVVPSSRRPDPPEVAYVIPTFRWTDEPMPVRTSGGLGAQILLGQRRIRHGGGLRVYLRRPWYSSGDGELLGVVLQNQPWLTWPLDQRLGLEVELADQRSADDFVTKAAERGAVKLAGAAGAPLSERLLRGVGVSAAQLRGEVEGGQAKLLSGVAATLSPVIDILADVTQFGDPETLVTRVGADPVFGSATPSDGPYIHQFPLRTAVRSNLELEETNKAKVTVVGHTPKFDADRKLWYCDIELDAGASYQPFVRLGLCRYQPHSIDGQHLSRVVIGEFAQLLPERTATVRPLLGGRTSVSLRGPAGFGELGAGRTPAGSIALTRHVSATVQRLADGDDPDLAWATVGEPISMPPTVGAAGLGDVSWSGTLGAFTREDGWTYRVLLQEFEIHPTDDGDTEDPFEAAWQLRTGSVEFPNLRPVRQRLVYADTFAL
ncbi:hypothetical protein FR943_06815 [Mycobacterium sp. TNTM28]|uniref:Alpha-mannosidase n=1 Tax=[Mycobacterium] fortunisiensis TaxID=2600579 RepID=A0ABS6KJ01_9MYCO|nr:hypothetical protein [[Mycobacterium] fortunisiensis]MBU9763552.1 hypothetical protein [[Mycobacterium] fortunisiensis]